MNLQESERLFLKMFMDSVFEKSKQSAAEIVAEMVATMDTLAFLKTMSTRKNDKETIHGLTLQYAELERALSYKSDHELNTEFDKLALEIPNSPLKEAESKTSVLNTIQKLIQKKRPNLEKDFITYESFGGSRRRRKGRAKTRRSKKR